MSSAPAAPPQASRTETNRWVVLVLVCFAQFMVVLDATIVNVALPSIQHDLDFWREGAAAGFDLDRNPARSG